MENEELFRAMLKTENGTAELPTEVESALYGKAYDLGHSAGDSEIEHYYGELADLVLTAYRAGAKS